MIIKREKFNINFHIDYQLKGNDNNKQLIVLLHGYGQNSDIIYEDLKDIIDRSDSLWLIPNAPFPIPKVRQESILYRFAWYFYDRFKEEYFIDFQIPSDLLSGLINENYKDYQVIIVGYSQGGYLAPFAASKIHNIKKVIGINCNFRFDLMDFKIKHDLIHIHALNDQLVDYHNAYHSLKKIQSHNEDKKVIHIKVENGLHEITDLIRDELTTYLSDTF